VLAVRKGDREARRGLADGSLFERLRLARREAHVAARSFCLIPEELGDRVPCELLVRVAPDQAVPLVT